MIAAMRPLTLPVLPVLPVLLAVQVLLAAGCGDSGGDGTGTADPGDAPGSVARMALEHAGDSPVPSEAATTEPGRPVTGSETSYGQLGDQALVGYLARPTDAEGPLPGLIVIHEWWGLNANIRAMTERLAAEGYAALAVDLYQGEVAGDPARARELAGGAMKRVPELEANLRQAHAFLAERSGAPKVGSIGWCFGGGWSLATAVLLPDEIDATVIYYGRLVSDPAQLESISTPILGLFGSEDGAIPVASVRAFESELVRLGKPVEIHIYDGAHHAFANPSGTRYDAAAAEDAWRRTTAFLQSHLQ
jgi:carboxymethylenebutenolidase